MSVCIPAAEYFIVRNNPSVIAIFRDNAIDYEV